MKTSQKKLKQLTIASYQSKNNCYQSNLR